MPIALADLDRTPSGGEPRAFSFLAGAPALLVKFQATAKVLREADGEIRGAILVLPDLRS